ncbi:AraC family transcriptional regulator [Oscillospiraceae bacterium HV4-5-C5C]|nr:AraC family transcriptional regulator [Oscillospiraceae bacterium HV4-5-C5C]
MDKCVGFTKSKEYICLEDLAHSNTFSSFESVVLDYCGLEQCAPGHHFGPYIRKNYVIHVVLNGSGKFTNQCGSFTLRQGQAFLIRPNESTVYQADHSVPWQYCWIGFHGYRSKEYLNSMGFTEFNPVINVDEYNRIQTVILQILDAGSLCPADELFRMSGLLAILGILIKGNSDDQPSETCKNNIYVKFAIDYMRHNFQKKFKISDLADEIGISRSYLTQEFKAITHMSPQDFLINLRMESAAHQLSCGNHAVSEIATQSGYEDALTFSKSFKKKYGVSPSEYRKNKSYLLCEEEKGQYKNTVPL